MNKATTIILLIILIAAGGFILFGKSQDTTYNSNNTTDQATVPSANEGANEDQVEAKADIGTTVNLPTSATVTYTDQGFSPGVLTIAVGGSVTFVNNSGGKMWVASNPHPMHTDYSSFDEKTAVSNGGTYTHTFTKAGQFGYHNHSNTSKVGIVTVR